MQISLQLVQQTDQLHLICQTSGHASIAPQASFAEVRARPAVFCSKNPRVELNQDKGVRAGLVCLQGRAERGVADDVREEDGDHIELFGLHLRAITADDLNRHLRLT